MFCIVSHQLRYALHCVKQDHATQSANALRVIRDVLVETYLPLHRKSPSVWRLIAYVCLDAEAVLREEEAISPDGLSVAQLREIKERAQNFTFQTEVNRMMKLIINSLYRNKEVRFRLLCVSTTLMAKS